MNALSSVFVALLAVSGPPVDGAQIAPPTRGFTRSEIEASLKAPFTVGIPIIIPIRLPECRRCVSPRREPIQRIVVHSTNDRAAAFAAIIAWIHSSIGSQREAFFATYYIDKAGRVVQVVPESVQTPHIRPGNLGSIGIELYDDAFPYSASQIAALETLTKDLIRRYGLTADAVFRHKDFTDHPLHQDPYAWTEAEWRAFKIRIHETR